MSKKMNVCKVVAVINKTKFKDMPICTLRHIVTVNCFSDIESVKKEYYRKYEKLAGDDFLVFDDMLSAKTYLKKEEVL